MIAVGATILRAAAGVASWAARAAVSTRAYLSVAKTITQFIVVDSLVGLIGTRIKWVRDNKEIISMLCSAGFLTKFVRRSLGRLVLKPPAAFFGFTKAAARAAPFMKAARTEISAKVKEGIRIVRAQASNGEYFEVAYDLANKSIKFAAKNPKATAAIAAMPIAGKTLITEGDPEALAALAESGLALASMFATEEQMAEARRYFSSVDSFDLAGKLNYYLRVAEKKYPMISRETIVSIAGDVSESIEVEIGETTYETGVDLNSGLEYVIFNDVVLLVQEDGSLRQSSKLVNALGRPAHKAEAYVPALMRLQSAMDFNGDIELVEYDDALLTSRPALANDHGVRLMASVDDQGEIQSCYIEGEPLSVITSFIGGFQELFGNDWSYDEDNDIISGESWHHDDADTVAVIAENALRTADSTPQTTRRRLEISGTDAHPAVAPAVKSSVSGGRLSRYTEMPAPSYSYAEPRRIFQPINGQKGDSISSAKAVDLMSFFE